MNAPDKLPAVSRAPRDEDLRPPADGAVARPRLLGLGHRRQEVPRRARRHRRQHARPRAPEAGAGAAGPDRQADPHAPTTTLVPLQEQLAAKLCELSGLTNVFFCNTGLEANEGGAEDRAQVRPRQGHRAARDHRLREGLPRPLDRHAVGHRQPQGAGRLRPAGRRLRARAAERRRRRSSRSRATQPERRRGVPRGDPGRRRHQPGARSNTCSRCAASATSAAGC